jgi:hypothetical protein
MAAAVVSGGILRVAIFPSAVLALAGAARPSL